MKKNLLSIVILALLIINLVLTSIMMFSVMSTNKKTAAIVTDIAAVLQLEIGTEKEDTVSVSMEDTAVHNISQEMTILLTKTPSADGEPKDHYAMVGVSLSMDTTHDDYETYGTTIADKESLIIGVITDVIGKYTADQVQPRSEDIKAEILKGIQDLFDSDFIYDVTFSKLIVQ